MAAKKASQNKRIRSGFFDWLDRCDERKKQQLERERRELDADIIIKREVTKAKAHEKNWTLDKQFELEKKVRKHYRSD